MHRVAFLIAAIAVLVAGPALDVGIGAPCAKHPVKVTHDHKGKVTRAACVKQLKRDRMDWPPNPKAWEIKRRVGAYHWNKAARVANCETGGTRGATRYRGNLNWHLTGTYQGPLGMHRQTAAYGKRVTGYWGPRLTWPQWVAVSVASHPITRGWSGWGCGAA